MIDIHYMEHNGGRFLLNKYGKFSQYSSPSYNIFNGKTKLGKILSYDINEDVRERDYKASNGRLFLEHKFIEWD